MEQTVLFRDRQFMLADDFNALQASAQTSIDALIAAAVVDRPVYRGFDTVMTDVATIKVGAGRYFAGDGAVYVRETETVRNFVSLGQLPAVALKKVAIVTYGATEETKVEQRKFRIDAVTGQVEADDVPMRLARNAQLAFLVGQESADPQLPAIDAGYVHVATVTLSTGGVQSIEMNPQTAAANLAGVAAVVSAHEAMLSVFQGMFVTLRTDMSALAERQRLLASAADVQAMGANLARLNARAGIAGNALAFGDNLFLDETGSDPAYAGYDAKIFLGLRFPELVASTSALQLFNPNDTSVSVTGGFCIPAYDTEARVTIDGYAGEMALANYQSQTVEMVQRTRTRERVVAGETSEVVALINDPNYDRKNKLYTKDGETFPVAAEWWNFNPAEPALIVLSGPSTTVTETEAYWDSVTSTTTVQGSTLAQSYLNAQAGYTVGVDVYFTDVAAAGDVHCHLVECDASGKPDMTKGVATVTKAPAALKKHPTATRFGLPPTILEAGKRYAFVFISQGAHRMAVADKNRYAAGQLFSSTDSAWFNASGDKDLLMAVQFCRFQASRATVQLQPLQLAGGMSDLDFLYESARVAGTDLIFEAQPQGAGEWFTINGPNAVSALAALPAQVNLRLTFVGSHDVMPGLKLSDSVARCFRRKTAFKHVTPVLTRVSTSTVKVTAYLRGFDAAAPASNTCVAKLLIGGVTETHDLVTDEVLPAIGGDPGGIKRTWTFMTAAPTATYRIELSGASADARKVFIITECVDQAL